MTELTKPVKNSTVIIHEFQSGSKTTRTKPRAAHSQHESRTTL